jgi:hypothetical protein
MHDGRWTIAPCPPEEAAALAGALGVSETLAAVLIRRRLGAVDEAQAFLAGER